MTTDTEKLAELALRVADEMETPTAGHRMDGLAQLLRRLAQALLVDPELEPDRCPECEAPVVQNGQGRPRVYCSRRCKDAAARRKRVDMRRCAP